MPHQATPASEIIQIPTQKISDIVSGLDKELSTDEMLARARELISASQQGISAVRASEDAVTLRNFLESGQHSVWNRPEMRHNISCCSHIMTATRRGS
jgi:hypothetical protein